MLHLFIVIAFNLEKGSKRHFYDASDFNKGSSKVLGFFFSIHEWKGKFKCITTVYSNNCLLFNINI